MSDFVTIVPDPPEWGECGDSAEGRTHPGPHTWGLVAGQPLRMCHGWPVAGANVETPVRGPEMAAIGSPLERAHLLGTLGQDLEVHPGDFDQYDLARVALDRVESLLIAARDLANVVARMRGGEPLPLVAPLLDDCHDRLMARLRDAGIVR